MSDAKPSTLTIDVHFDNLMQVADWLNVTHVSAWMTDKMLTLLDTDCHNEILYVRLRFLGDKTRKGIVPIIYLERWFDSEDQQWVMRVKAYLSNNHHFEFNYTSGTPVSEFCEDWAALFAIKSYIIEEATKFFSGDVDEPIVSIPAGGLYDI